MYLDVDKKNMTIMGIRYENKKEFRIVWNVISSNMTEGKPTVKDVQNLQKKLFLCMNG